MLHKNVVLHTELKTIWQLATTLLTGNVVQKTVNWIELNWINFQTLEANRLIWNPTFCFSQRDDVDTGKSSPFTSHFKKGRKLIHNQISQQTDIYS